MKIAIAGTGYLELSNCILLSQRNEVIAQDIILEKVALVNKCSSPTEDKNAFVGSFKATLDKEEDYKDANFVIIFNSKIINF